MIRFASKTLRVAALLCALAAPSAAFAGEWVVRENPIGPGYVVTDDETGTIHTKGRKAAEKIAKILNKADSDEGFVDTGEGPCGDPLSGVLC
jgi:hypothetical protein